MNAIFFGIGAAAIMFTLLPLLKSDRWWIRVLDYPRFQILALGLTSFFGYLIFDQFDYWAEFILLAGLILCIGYQLLTIIPYTPLYRKQVKNADVYKGNDTIGLLVANVLMSNRNSGKLLEIIDQYKPDIILLVEADQWWHDKLDRLKETHPKAITYPLNNTYGLLFYSKLKLKNSKVRFLVEEDIPSIYAEIQLANDKIIEFYGLHPTPPVPGENLRATERDAELLIIGKAAKKTSKPVIVAGDLNDVAWSYTTKLFQKISGLLDPRVGRGLYNTFHAKYPFLRWPLDHIFHSNHFKVIQLERLTHFGSDHFPIYIKLHLDPIADLQQEEPTPDKEEKKEAEEKIEKV